MPSFENGDEIEIVINYKKETVKCKGTINGKSLMNIREFALVVLGIEPESKEFIAAFIGKELGQGYNKTQRYYEIKSLKIKKNIFIGTIKKI